jgi:hypothetical protein
MNPIEQKIQLFLISAAALAEMLVHCCGKKKETYHVVLAGSRPFLHSAAR